MSTFAVQRRPGHGYYESESGTQLNAHHRTNNGVEKAKKFGVVVLWWLLSLWALFYAPAPYTPGMKQLNAFTDAMDQVNGMSNEVMLAATKLSAAERDLAEVHVWFWRWRGPPYDTEVPARKEAVRIAKAESDLQNKKQAALVSEAKASLGIWSSIGIQETRDIFWGMFKEAKSMVLRMSITDAIFIGLSGQGEESGIASIISFFLRSLFSFLINLVTSFFYGSICLFMKLISLVRVYKTSLPSALIYLSVTMSLALGVLSLVVASAVGTVAGGVVGVYYGTAKLAMLRDAEGRRRRRIDTDRPSGRRPHYD